MVFRYAPFLSLYAILFLAYPMHAQIVVPLESNPVLQEAAAREREAQSDWFVTHFGRVAKPLDETRELMQVRGGIVNVDVLCIPVGDTVVFCTDTIGQTQPGASYECLNCGEAVYGSAQLDSTCLTYIAENAVEFGIDTIVIEYCDGTGNCETIIYHLGVHRTFVSDTLPLTVLQAESMVTIDLDLSALPGPARFPTSLGCRDPLLADAYVLDDKLFYTARRFAGEDTVCLLIADRFCIEDTAVYPFSIFTDTLQLGEGFVEDFSAPSPFPSADLWLDRRAFVNRTLGVNPPTLGVATFDGLDETGTPYGGGYGISDLLTSSYIDLSPGAIGPTDVYLSFFIQPKGMGYSLQKDDSLVVEFKAPTGEWKRIDAFTQDTFYTFWQSPQQFEFHWYKLDEAFLYNGFQFRFSNYSPNSKTMEPWHLDMVRLEPRNIPPNERFDDMSFIALPPGILKRYRAMPWGHFKGFAPQETRQDYAFTVRSNFNTAVSLDDSRISVREAPFASSPDFLPLITTFDATNFNPGEQKSGERLIPDVNFSDLLQSLEDLPDADERTIVNRYTLNPGKDQDNVPGLLRNDTVDFNTTFGDYFAYDDGTAEQRILPGNTGERLAVRFTANTDDTLRAVMMHIPHYPGSYPSSNFRLQVYVGELDDEPEYQQTFLKTFYADQLFDTLQGFTTFVLLDVTETEETPLFIPAGDFYVGWETNFTPVPVGFDRNSPSAAQHLFFKSAQDWVLLDTVSDYAYKGAVMIRPVMGGATPVHTPSATDDLFGRDLPRVDIFPNPTTGLVTVSSSIGLNSGYEAALVDDNGRVLRQWSEVPQSFSLSPEPPGWYALRVSHRASGQVLTFPVIRVD